MWLIGATIIFVWACIYASMRFKVFFDRITYYVTTSKMWYVKNMRKYKGIIKTAIDFLVFWVIFIWNDGCVSKFLTDGGYRIYMHVKRFCISIGRYLLELWNILVMLSPFGREIAQIPEFRYCLIIGSICVAMALVIFAYILADEFNWFISWFISPIAAFSMWYIFYFACLWLGVYLIPVWFYFFGLIASVILGGVSFAIVMFLLFLLFDF